MHATATVHAPVTPMALETIVAVVLVAVLVTIGIAAVYAIVAGSLAWVLMLVVGVLRLVWLVVRGAARGVRARLHRAPDRIRQITPETVPDLRVRPLG